MNKYTWGNIAGSSYLDPDSYRYISMYAGSIFGETAQDLLLMGEQKKAKDVVNNAYTNLPNRVYTMGEVLSYVPLVDVMYKVGESTKANEIVKRNLQYIRENLQYYMAVAETKPNLEYRNMRFGLASIQRYQNLLKTTNQKELIAEADKLFETYKYLYGE